MPPPSHISLVDGPSHPPLWSKTVKTLIEEQVHHYGDKTAVVVPWQSMQISYRQLAQRSKLVAKALLEMGIKLGSHIGIMAGNRHEYIEIFLGGARIGCPVVLHNLSWSPTQLSSAVVRSSCEVIFLATTVGAYPLHEHIKAVSTLPSLQRIILLEDGISQSVGGNPHLQPYNEFLNGGYSVFQHDSLLEFAENKVKPTDLLSLMFTSGSTGFPKAAMLTHLNLINNARLCGENMHLGSSDVVVCAPPLFHCFGITMGLLASLSHGSTIVFPSDRFHARETVDAIIHEKATALLGVPTMFLAGLDILQATGHKVTTLRTGIIAGSSVPEPLMHRIKDQMGISGLLIAYGMTETSPTTFMTALEDPYEKRVSTLGNVMAHTSAKVIDKNGNIVPWGLRGEICTSGYALQTGYYKDEVKTREVMHRDKSGTLWMHTGDEGFIDEEGYGHITGRIKDLIIRGGENIAPAEIEERLLAHPSIVEACVVGLEDKRYGEAVSCFLRLASNVEKPLADVNIKEWVVKSLGKMRMPQYVFWMGDDDVGIELPKNGSGKIQKHLVREMGNRLVGSRISRAKL